MEVNKKKLVLVGSNSVHTKRFIRGIIASASEYQLVAVITNQFMDEFAEVEQLCVDFSLHSLSTIAKIKKKLSLIQPDVIHIHQANSYAWHTIRAINKLSHRPRVILTCWGSDIQTLPNKSKLMHKMVVHNLRNADVITTDSLFITAQVVELLGAFNRPTSTINFGIQDLPTKQLLANKKKLILSNRLHKTLYRIDKIISAFAKLVSNNLIDSEYQLVIAGGGDETLKLEKLVNDLQVRERVIFTGMIDYSGLIKYYQDANIFVSVPENDGTSSSLLEAMGYGCIPVLSCVPANLEWVINGKNGIISPNLANLDIDLLNAIKLSDSLGNYQAIYDFNYQLISEKAIFGNNIQKFIELY